MATPIVRSSSSSFPSLPPPLPKSPPDYPDLYGKRREMARVQMLEREISFLEVNQSNMKGVNTSVSYIRVVVRLVLSLEATLSVEEARRQSDTKGGALNAPLLH
ncbi:hypothetical protein Lal_00031222 [Lupinus albus]|nr:hypothetical protein Lal_00031222 [Lupinus albus]